MRAIRAAVMSVLLVIGLAAPAQAAPSQRVAGTFTANVDFSTVQLKDARGGNCLLTVNGTLSFSGSLKGHSVGTTTALEAAPCSAVAAPNTPPGTYSDVFKFRGNFVGKVSGRTVDNSLTYTGVTHVGGHIDAVIALRGGGIGPMRADATVAVGGSYSG